MKRIVVLISGTGSNMQAIQQACENGKVAGEVVAVISNKASAKGLEKRPKKVLAPKCLATKSLIREKLTTLNLKH